MFPTHSPKKKEKRLRMKKCLLFLAVAAMTFTSCSDDLGIDSPKTDDKIGYNVSVAGNGNVDARSGKPMRDVTISELSTSFRGEALYLHTVVSDSIPTGIKNEATQSRGEKLDATMLADMKVSSVVYNDAWIETSGQLYMNSVSATAAGNWSTNYYWPLGHDRIRFFAVAPAEVNDANGAVVLPSAASSPKFDYAVPAEVVDQQDVLVAINDYAANYCATADIDFAHALTAVQFVTDVPNIVIKEVKIKGVYHKGTYSYIYNDDSQAKTSNVAEGWTVDESSKADYTLSGLNVAVDGGDVTINEGKNVFMLMPQTVPAGATVEVTLMDTEGHYAGQDLTIPVSIAGFEWKQGQNVKYKLSANDENTEYFFDVVNNRADNVPFYGGKGSYKVQSYKVITDRFRRVRIEPVAWSVTDIPAGYEFPVGLNQLSVLSGNGVSSDTEWEEVDFNYSVLPNLEKADGVAASASHETFIPEGYTLIGSKTAPLDLSMCDIHNYGTGVQNTSNCYLVRSPGYYMFPLVYGNAIKNGVDNVNAYTSNVTEASVTATAESMVGSKNNSGVVTYTSHGNVSATVKVLKQFRDHANGSGNGVEGNPITQPWITKQPSVNGAVYEAGSAEVVWQDEPCLVTEVELCKVNGNDYMRFRLHEQSICNGNAVLAVKNTKGEIMWSWHIWVTRVYGNAHTKDLVNRRVLGNYSPKNVQSWTREESSFKILSYPVGYCPADTKTYRPRTIAVNFAQNEAGGKTDVMNINQAGDLTNPTANMVVKQDINSLYYQWGRKDPMLPRGEGGNDKPYYDNAGNRHTAVQKSGYASEKTIAWTIQHPEMFTSAQTVKYMTGSSSAPATAVEYRNWCNEVYINLWNANCKSLPMFSYTLNMTPDKFHAQFNNLVNTEVVKTVYDPCPQGMEMPRIDAFSGVNIEGVNMAPFYVHADEVNSKNEWIDDAGNVWGTQFYPEANASTFVRDYDVDLGLFLSPMPAWGEYSGDPNGIDNSPYSMFLTYLGHRNETGSLASTDTYISALSSSMMCMQSSLEDTKAFSFLLHGSRLCVIRGGSGRASKYRTGKTDYGTLRPFSTSTFDLGFNVYPVHTDMNPVTTTSYN